jgi:hypothetical protein
MIVGLFWLCIRSLLTLFASRGSVPVEVAGQPYILTADSDKGLTGASALTFTVCMYVCMYVYIYIYTHIYIYIYIYRSTALHTCTCSATSEALQQRAENLQPG